MATYEIPGYPWPAYDPFYWTPDWGTTLADDVVAFVPEGDAIAAFVDGSVYARSLAMRAPSNGYFGSFTIDAGSTLTVAGSIINTDTQYQVPLTLDGAVVHASEIDGVDLDGAGLVDAVVNGGTIGASGNLEVTGAITATVALFTGGVLLADAGIAAGSTIELSGGTLALHSGLGPDAIAGTLTQFAPVAAIDLRGVAWQSDTIAGVSDGTLTVSTDGTTDLSAPITDVSSRFYTMSDGAGGILVTSAIQNRVASTPLDWNSASSWRQGIVPGATDVAAIDGPSASPPQMVVSAADDVASLTLASGSLTIADGGTLDAGDFLSQGSIFITDGGSLEVGALDAAYVAIADGGMLEGTLVPTYGSVVLSGGTFAGQISGEFFVSGYGTVTADLFGQFGGDPGWAVTAASGTLALDGHISAENLLIDGAAVLEFGDDAVLSAPSGDTRPYVGLESGATLALTEAFAHGTGFHGMIGWPGGDPGVIDLLDQRWSAGVAATFDASGTTLTVADGATLYATLPFAYGINEPLYTRDDGHGGTLVESVACYCRGTLIATPDGQVRVEALHIGDHVTTHAGAARPIRWIGTRSYDGRFIRAHRDVLPIRIRAGALGENVPRRDLLVSPHHAMFVDGVLVPAELLINGVSVVQEEAVERVEYFHIELDSHDILLAEGAPAESFVDCDSRGMFQNAVEFARLYPDAMREAPRFCAPRIEGGAELAHIRARLAARAGIAPREKAGPFIGQIDEAGAGRIAGWAEDESGEPVAIRVVVDDLALPMLAGLYRADLGRRSGFAANHALRLARDIPHLVRVQRERDGAGLVPVLLPALPRTRLSGGDPLALISAAERLARTALRRAG